MKYVFAKVSSDMIFFDRLMLSEVKFRKFFAEFVKPIALFKLGDEEWFTTKEI